MGTLDALLGQLSPLKKTRGTQFERICQWFLTHDPVYAPQMRRVWMWDDWPGKWGGDTGIDLVAETHAGTLWAVQAKAYDEKYSVKKKDVDSFLAESGGSDFAFRLLIATTDHIGKNAIRTIENQAKRASVLLRGHLDVAEVDWPASPSDLRANPLPRKRPWEHQVEAIDAVIRHFDRTDRGQMIMACGTGKTLTALFIHERLQSERTLVLVPSLSLLGQTIREWNANALGRFETLPVCSDQTVSDDDAIVSSPSELGIPVTTNPRVIGDFIDQPGPRVIFCTYQSSPQISEAFKLNKLPAFDLVIADEAHRCAGPVTSEFATILNSQAIPAARRLFMTATPRYFTGRLIRQAEEADFEIASMDNEAIFGPVFHRLGFGAAIGRGLLTDYQVAIVGVNDATYGDWARDGKLVSASGAMTNARTLAGQIGLLKAMAQYELRRTISFHSRVKRAREFAGALTQIVDWLPEDQRPGGALWSDYVSGDMAAGKRSTLLKRLADLGYEERGLLSNARCLAEGVDVPALDSVAFIDPKRSEVDIVQAVGRAIRLSSEKETGTIIIPVFIPSDQDPSIALDTSSFTTVWDVVKALRAHDDALGHELDELRQSIGRLAHGQTLRLPRKISLDLPTRVTDDFAAAFTARLVELTTASWEFWFGLMEQYVEENGHARVPKPFKAGARPLGEWVKTQRTAYDKGRLSVERAQRLEELNGWTWDPFADQWEHGFRRLSKYIDAHGSANVAASLVHDKFKIGRWVTTQRVNRIRGTLDEGRSIRLEKLPGWTWDAKADKWEEGFTRLRQFAKENGSARTVATLKVDGFSLGAWVVTQRGDFAKGVLSDDRKRRLEGLTDWTWDPFADQWEEGFHRLNDYVLATGNARVPVAYTASGFPLGKWVDKQRINHRKGVLDSDRENRLDSLPGWAWDAQVAKWEDGFSRVVAYVNSHGHANVPASYKIDGYGLGGWVRRQRILHEQGVLDTKRVRRLEGLTNWTWTASN
ncbi:Helicase associated domain protein [Mycolicibacterium sp. A43C]